jgi:hypothetical protein
VAGTHAVFSSRESPNGEVLASLRIQILPAAPYLDTVEVWRSSRHGPTTVFKDLQGIPA